MTIEMQKGREKPQVIGTQFQDIRNTKYNRREESFGK